MSLTKEIRGKQRSRCNAVKHNLSGQNLILLENERDNDSDDEIEPIAAQTCAWIERANSFDLRRNSNASRRNENPAQLKKRNEIPSIRLRLANSLPSLSSARPQTLENAA